MTGPAWPANWPNGSTAAMRSPSISTPILAQARAVEQQPAAQQGLGTGCHHGLSACAIAHATSLSHRYRGRKHGAQCGGGRVVAVGAGGVTPPQRARVPGSARDPDRGRAGARVRPAGRPGPRRPPCSTTMRSKLRTVERRCAIAITVRPRISRSSACADGLLGFAVERGGRLVEQQRAAHP